MDTAERYRQAAAKRLASLRSAGLEVHECASVTPLNAGLERGNPGDGAFVEVQLWVPAAAIVSESIERTH